MIASIQFCAPARLSGAHVHRRSARITALRGIRLWRHIRDISTCTRVRLRVGCSA